MRRSLVPILFAKPGWVLPGATLDMDFANNRAWRKGNGLTLPASLLTTTRASTGYAATSSGLLVPFSANIPRVTDLGLLVEQAATNLALQSQTFNTTWSTASVTVTADQGTAPDGTLTADRIVYAGGLGTPDNRRIEQAVTISGGTSAKSFAVAFWIKSNTGSSQALRLKNTQGGVLDSFSAITATATWQRFTFALTNAASAGNGSQTLGVAAAVADTAFDVLIWQGQLENSAFNTSDIPTTTVAVTRAADVVTFNSVAPFANGFGAFISVGAIPSFAATTHFLSAASGNRIFYASGNTALDAYNGTTILQANPLSGDLSTGFRGAVRLQTADRALAVNSGTIGTDSNTNGVPATVYIGSLNGTGSQNAYTKRIAIFSTLTNAQIASLAALP